AKLYREQAFECIDSHWIYPDGFAAVLAGKMLGVPVFCSARGTDVNVYPTMPVIRHLIGWTLRRADGIIAVSQALKDVMVAFGIAEEKIRVIGNGADINRFYPTDREEARKRLRLPISGRLVVSVGSLTEHKGHSGLIAAFGKLLRRWPDL